MDDDDAATPAGPNQLTDEGDLAPPPDGDSPDGTSAADDAAPDAAPDAPRDAGAAEEPADDLPGSPSLARTAAFAVVRAGVVLAVAVVAYQAVIPVHHVSRARLAHLVPTKPGLAAYNNAQSSGAEQPANQSDLTAMKSAAAKSPNQSGVYTIGWQASQSSGAGIAAFLYPSAAQAATGYSELVTHELSATAYQSNGLKRQTTFSVAGVPGSTGAVFVPTKAGGGPQLGLAAFRHGRVDVIVEVFSTSPNQSDASTLAANEDHHLASVLPGFSLTYETHPATATALWVAGSAVLALLAAFGPAGWRWQRRRRQRRWERELASRVVVGGQVIHKRRV